MSSALRIAALGVLAVCGWSGADGLRRASALDVFSRVHVPWDADRLPGTAPNARILALRPVSPFARFRDALSRSEGADGDAFRAAARGVLRWGRNQPGTLLELGKVAMYRWKERGVRADREVGESLLVEYTARTTHAESEGVDAWLAVAAPTDDPWPVFRAAPGPLWPVVGVTLWTRYPAAAWRFLEPALRDGTLDPRYVQPVTALARIRRQPSDLGVLRLLHARADLAPESSEDLRKLIVDLEGVR